MKRFLGSSLLAVVATLAGCEQAPSKLDPVVKVKPQPATRVDTAKPGDPHGGMAATPETPAKDIDSKDILARTEEAPEAFIKQVLIAWKELEPVYRGQMAEGAKTRTNDAAAALAQDILKKVQANPSQVDALVKEHNEMPGEDSTEPMPITAKTQYLPEVVKLAVRLKPNEAGIVKSMAGYHVVLRVPAPPLDPLESADILSRTTPETGTVQVQHVLVGWKGAPGARAATRSKEEADKLAQEILAKAKTATDLTELMKQYSEDPGSKDSGKAYDVNPDSPMVEPFKKMSLRLKVGEAGLVKSPFGWHVIKRVPPPPPDPLESADILKREPVTQKAKVKHILLGWDKLNSDDERAKKRTREQLDKLVKDTMAKLKGGAKIEPLMAELSEDPGSAKSGTDYDVTPDAGLVEPFKNLSLRLNKGEVGAVKTNFGIHIIQRTE